MLAASIVTGMVVASTAGVATGETGAPAVVAGDRYLPTGPVGEAGRWMTDPQGRVLLVHGVNVVAKDAPFYPSAFGFDDADASFLAANGMRVVRLGVLASGEMPTRGRIDRAYIDRLVATVDDLGRHHVFTLLDWHQDEYGTYFDDPGTVYRADGFPAWMTITDGAPDKPAVFPTGYEKNPAIQEAFDAFWADERIPGGKPIQDYDLTMLKAVAKRVAGNPWVLGYEVMNEPFPGSKYLTCLSADGCPQLERSDLEPFYARAAAAIRSVDPAHLIFFEPFVLYDFGTSPTHLAFPPGVAGTGMSYHEYGLSPQDMKKVFTLTIAWSKTHDGALLNTEWSASGGTASSIQTQAADEDDALMPWTYWVFDNCDIACVGASYANLLLDPDVPPTGSNVNAPIADSVVRDYPIAVAGTPETLSFDPTTRVMNFTWSTARVTSPGSRGRGSFGPGAVTVFATPARIYPHGYTVHATGAKVVTPAGSPTLAVVQVGIVHTVTVTVDPRS
jgi:endoglycosylceramidase